MNLILIKLRNFFKTYFPLLFLLCLFLIKIPPMYLIPAFKSSIFSTYGFFSILIILLFSTIAILSLLSEREFIHKNDKKLLSIFFVYFFFQSISILGALRFSDFIHSYKNIFLSGIFLFLTLYYKNHYKNYQKKIILLILLTSGINFIYQLFIFLLPDLYAFLGDYFIYQGHFNLVVANMYRGRIFVETYDEIAIPFVFIYFLENLKYARRIAVSIFLFSMIALPSFLSDFRTRIIMLAFASISTIFLILRNKLVRIYILILFMVVMGISYLMMNLIYGYSFIDRLSFQSNAADVETIDFRLKSLFYAFDMGVEKPFTGVGLGNYYNNLPTQKISSPYANDISSSLTEASYNPHNIFAEIVSETGFLSLFCFIFMLIYFLISDFRVLFRKETKAYDKGLVISFWTLFIYALFNPVIGLPYNTLFWSLRGLIALT